MGAGAGTGGEPAWAWAVVGWLAVQVALARVDARASGPALRGPPPPLALREMDPRDLRRLPGIGDRRAVEIARARWEHDPRADGTAPGPLLLTDVRGIGPVTAARVRAWLADRGALAGDTDRGDADALVLAPDRGGGGPPPGEPRVVVSGVESGEKPGEKPGEPPAEP